MIDELRLKNAIKQAFVAEQEDTGNPTECIDRISAKIAQAIVAELKQITITYNAGLIAPPGGGAVTGTLNYTIT